MYVVIFRATVKAFDAEYVETAQRLRDLALSDYGCLEFTACTENDQEIAISYWSSLDEIKAWHQNPEHRRAQALGKAKWYASYRVEVTKMVS